MIVHNLIPNALEDSTMAYTLMINEEQRKLMVAAINKSLTCPDFIAELQALAGVSGLSSVETQQEELSMISEMLAELPVIEKESPGILHGLCL